LSTTYCEVGHAIGGDVDLDLDELPIEAYDGAGESLGEHRTSYDETGADC